MDIEKIPEIKENLLRSENIFNLIANLYYLCSTKFTKIYNLIQQDSYKTKFVLYFHTYKLELLEKCDDIWGVDFPKIISIFRKSGYSGAEEFLLNTWAFLKAIDWVISGDMIFLRSMNSIKCHSSIYFGNKEFILLFKPNNLIFDTIKNNPIANKIKIGFDIGQRIENHLQKIILYEEHFSRKIEINKIDPLVDELLWHQHENLAFAVAPISYDFDYTFLPFKSSQKVSYVFDKIKNSEEIKKNIDRVFKRCIKEKVHIVVFPELSINGELGNYISNWLRENNTNRIIIMVVAGSYHTLIDEKKNLYENISIVYRFDGMPLWKQKKMNQFKLDEEDLKKLRTSSSKGFQTFIKMFRKSDKSGEEKIKISDTLKIYDTSIGRMAVTICLDYFVEENKKLLVAPHVNLIFVPSMSPSLEKFNLSNFDIGSYGLASVFCANSCWITTGGEKGKFDPDNSSYIYIPKKHGLMRLDHCPECDCLNCKPKVYRILQDS